MYEWSGDPQPQLMEVNVRRILFGVVAAAAILGAASGSAFAADQYPTCKSKSDDHCMQSGAAMKMEQKAKGMGQKVGHKAAKMGHEMKTKMKPAAGKTGGAAGAIPHGCSPATTPYQ